MTHILVIDELSHYVSLNSNNKKVLMTKYLILLSFIITNSAQAFQWDDSDCGRKNAKEGKVFELNIGMSRTSSFSFKLCKKPDKDFLILASNNKPTKSNKKTTKKTIKLTKEQTEKLVEKYINALKYNTLDDATGLDGSSWCIESQRGFTYTKACFWTPGYNSEERGIAGLNELGIYLWKISELKKQGFKLY